MNKQTLKALRSQFRKISRDAFRAGGGARAFGDNVLNGEAAFRKENPTNFHFNWFEKPCKRQQVVSMKVFAHLDYPFKSLNEPKFN